MASKTFSLGEDGPKGACTKALLILILGAVIAAAVIVGIFAFKSSGSNAEKGCGSPELDPNGLSNYSTGADTIAFACFPGFFVDQRNSNVILSRCTELNKEWNPPPPTCNFLPLRLDCRVQHHGLEGQISIIQMSVQEPTNIFGLVKYENAIKSEGHINEIISISRQSPDCQLSQQYNITKELQEMDEIDDKYILKVRFESTSLAAYRKAEIHISMIFLDVNTMATLISVHQGDLTLVMPNQIPQYNGESSGKVDPTSTTTEDTTGTTIAAEAEIINTHRPRESRDIY